MPDNNNPRVEDQNNRRSHGRSEPENTSRNEVRQYNILKDIERDRVTLNEKIANSNEEAYLWCRKKLDQYRDEEESLKNQIKLNKDNAELAEFLNEKLEDQVKKTEFILKNTKDQYNKLSDDEKERASHLAEQNKQLEKNISLIEQRKKFYEDEARLIDNELLPKYDEIKKITDEINRYGETPERLSRLRSLENSTEQLEYKKQSFLNEAERVGQPLERYKSEHERTKETSTAVASGVAQGFKKHRGLRILGDIIEGFVNRDRVNEEFGSFASLGRGKKKAGAAGLGMSSEVGQAGGMSGQAGLMSMMSMSGMDMMGMQGIGGMPAGLRGVGKGGVAGALLGILDEISNTIISVAESLKEDLVQMVDKAATTLADFWGAVNANLIGYNNSSKAILDRASTALSFSGIIKMEDYLNNIRRLTDSGIAQGVETVALLNSIKEKTVSSFDAGASYLRQLVRLGNKSATERYFGLATILKKALNEQFGDSSYLNHLFESVNSTLKDSIMHLSDNSQSKVGYAGVVNAFAGYLYEAGMEDGSINKLVSAINALGSGNVQALTSDEGMMKLILLAMNQGGMNLADLLQGGLSATSTQTLLANVVDYVSDIANTTKNNNVLESSYANTFGLSMSDMVAFQNVSNKKFLGLSDLNPESVHNAVSYQLNSLTDKSKRLVSEKINNMLDNMEFSFGADIASSAAKYRAFKYSSVAMDVIKAASEMTDSKIVKTFLKIPMLAASGVFLTSAGMAGVNLLTDGFKELMGLKEGKNTVEQLFNAVSESSFTGKSGKISSREGLSTKVTDEGGLTDEHSNKYIKESSAAFKDVKDEDWEKEADSIEKEILEKLREYDGILMQNNKTKTKAIAVSLEGMANDVLRSFASIFADEDNMSDVFKKDSELNKQMFEFADDKTTSSSRQEAYVYTEPASVTGNKGVDNFWAITSPLTYTPLAAVTGALNKDKKESSTKTSKD